MDRGVEGAPFVLRAVTDVLGRKLRSQVHGVERIHPGQRPLERHLFAPQDGHSNIPGRGRICVASLSDIGYPYQNIQGKPALVELVGDLDHDLPHFLSHSRLQLASLLVHSERQFPSFFGQSSRHFSQMW